MLPRLEDVKIAVVGLGYVGLPLTVAFGKSRFSPVVGFDTSTERVDALRNGYDPNGEVEEYELAEADVTYGTDATVLKNANVILVTVPTPITEANQPDLTPVKRASQTIGEHMKSGTVIIYESTVYPGVTEEICAPILEKTSGLTCGKDFFVAYSPERTVPGDKEHTLETVVKVVSGMNRTTLNLVASLYEEICRAGVHRAPNIKTAEAEKVIENTQRDLNIALVNELSFIFDRLGIRTKDVIDAAATKWNFHAYQPGLVGGHCIGVDPYYLTHKAQELGYHPQVILAGRRINDSMAGHVADLMLRGLTEAGKVTQGARVLVLGLTFKEDIRDTRNSKIADTITRLKEHGVDVLGYDPNLDHKETESFGATHVDDLETMEPVDGIILPILHRKFRTMSLSDFFHYYRSDDDARGVFIDIKSHFFPALDAAASRKLIYKSL